MSNFIALVVITLALGMLFVLAGEARIFIDWYGLGFLMSFVYAATLISFGKNGMFKSLAGLRYLFSKDIIGGKPAEYYAQVYQQQIIYSYGGAFIAFLIGSVAIHGNADLTVPDEIHRAYAVNLLILAYAAIYAEALIRPLKVKFATCDTSEA